MVLAQDLRDAVLQAAMQGKLTEQLETDKPVINFLSTLFTKRDKMITNNEIPNDNGTTPTNESEYPFDIPDNWVWEKIGNLYSVSSGMTPLKNNTNFYVDGNIPWVNSSLTSNDYIYEATEFVTQLALKHTNLKIYPPHTLIVAMYGQGKTRGQVSELMISATINQACAALTNIVESFVFTQYTKIFLKFNYDGIRKQAGGSAQPNLNLDKVKNTYIPIPPIEEQQRIVDCVNALMAKIDEYEKIEKQLTTLKATFPADLRNAILQAAMQGKLTKQLETDSSVEIMLQEINEDKLKYLNGKVSKKDERLFLKVAENEERPYNIPDNWKWCKLGYLLRKLTDGTHKTPNYTPSGVRFISVKNISSGFIDFSNTKFISQGEHSSLYQRCNPEHGDMLLSKVGTTGIPAYVDTVEQFSLFVSVALLKFNHQYILPKFLYYLIYSPLVQKQAAEQTRGVGNQNWVLDKIANTLVIMPPLEEQQRIVDQLDALLPLCNRLINN